VPFDGSDGEYTECKGSAVEAEVEVLRTTPPPWIAGGIDVTKMMLTWTRGALRSAHDLISDTRARHAGEAGEAARDYEVVLMTDGDWTCPDRVGQGCDEDPAPEARLLFDDGVRVHVVAFGDATQQPSLHEVALQGGTGASIDAMSPKGIVDALGSVLDRIRDSLIVPECTRSLPRVLVIMDGSSSMIAGNAPGETNWDKARFALAGNPGAPNPGDPGYVEPIFARRIDVGGREVAIEDVVLLGLMVFAGADEQTSLADFGACMRDNFAWAMDPYTSCVAPGCTDPYAGYPIAWSYLDSDTDREPPFVDTTRSYMPACNMTMGSTSCVGTIPNTFTGQGLDFARARIAANRADPAPYFADAGTRYLNVLITDGRTSMGSSDVRGALEGMVADGVETHVIGFGTPANLDEAQLDLYAAWGGTGSAVVVDPSAGGSADALADAIATIVEGIDLDACCVLNDCAAVPEPPLPAPACGDGEVQGAEVCDDGADNASYAHCGARCDGPHLYCGDSRTDDVEECDDGNADEGDGCDSACMREDDDAGAATPGASGPNRNTDPSRTGALPGAAPGHGTRGADDAGADGGAAASNADACGCRAVGARHSGRHDGFGWVLSLALAWAAGLLAHRARALGRPL
jgi:cysteine-rich repeat protein